MSFRVLMIVALFCGPFSAIASCVPYCETFRYMSFEGSPGVEIVRYGIPELEGLIDVSDYPIEYSIRRGDYQINLVSTGYAPSVLVRVQANNAYQPIDLRLLDEQGERCKTAGGAFAKAEGSHYASVLSNCETGSLVVYVEDPAGSTVHAEQIQFKIVTNGRFCVWDAL